LKSNLNITLIAAGAALNGDLILDHGVSCFGLVDGSVVSTKGLLHIGEGGLVKGAVQGEHVQIDGKVEGDVHARESLEINGQVSGNIFYCGTIRLGPHASLNGALKRISQEPTIENESNVKEITRAVANQ
jgi:cytoskeletal protein CcmA (bactofilin family)